MSCFKEFEVEEKNGIKVGDTIKWSGNFINGYDEGVNKVIKVFYETMNDNDSFEIMRNIIWMRLDNNKIFIIDNGVKNFTTDRWKKLNVED